ncbi:MAG: hypothetical protein KAJ75_02135, partial [Alphaproteobacteria bacterium]|nr:hypothetical protein [Alphaproteobacteria bacterium]
DMDSIFILPLHLVPLEPAPLRKAKLIKNHRLESVVEIFSDKETGSGQVDVSELPKMFGWSTKEPHPDYTILRKLSLMPSYDVFSLRVLFREQGVKISDIDSLKLSDEKTKELNAYMTAFTRPLIMQIYGEDVEKINEFSDIIKLFRDPDIKKARERLSRMADKLGIEVTEVPLFLENYGDIFLSLSYYRQCLDRLVPLLDSFLDAMDDLRSNWQMRHDVNVMNSSKLVEEKINMLSSDVTGRFESFDLNTKAMWENISAARFQAVKELIESHHTIIGGVLCALTVKMNAWITNFPCKDSAGPVKRAEFLLSEMKPGIENMEDISDSAPMLSQID